MYANASEVGDKKEMQVRVGWGRSRNHADRQADSQTEHTTERKNRRYNTHEVTIDKNLIEVGSISFHP